MLSSTKRILTSACLLAVCVVYCASLSGRCLDRTLQENFDSHDVVFSGTVVEKKEASEKYAKTYESGNGEEWVIPAMEVSFEVDDNWKGTTEGHITVYTLDPLHPQSDIWVSHTRYPFESGVKYLVFAKYRKSQDHEDIEDAKLSRDGEKYLKTGYCSGNMVLDSNFLVRAFLVDVESQEDLINQLSKFKKKTDDAAAESDSEATDSLPARATSNRVNQ